MSEGLTLVSGTVSNLVVYDGEEEFISSANQRAATAGAAVGLVAAGMAGAAIGASIAATSAGDSVQFFTFDVGNKTVSGRFSKASFKAGDELVVVAESTEVGANRVVAVTRSSDQTLWIVPHCSRGVRAHRRFAMQILWRLMIGLPVFFIASYLILGVWANHTTLEMDVAMQLMAGISLVLGSVAAFYYSIRFYFQWRPIAQQAERIFSALGYPDPSRVDLPRDHKRYCKANGIQWPYLTDGAWIYHYLDPRDTSNV